MATLFHIVQQSGGISAAKLSSIGHTTRESFIQNGLLGVFRKHGRSLDDLATELIGLGIIPDCPDDISPSDYLLQLLIDERQGIDVLISRIEDTDSILEMEEQKALNDLRKELRLEGKTEEEIERYLDGIPEDPAETTDVENGAEDPERDKIIPESVFLPVKRVHTLVVRLRRKTGPLFCPVLRFAGTLLIRGHPIGRKEEIAIPARLIYGI